MATADADRNLLFGILALQLDFVTRDALIAAMNARVLEEHKPLGQSLVERVAMSEDDREALEAVVARHLKKHGDDPRRSLAALSSIGSAREHLEAVSDAELRASLAHVSAARPDDSPPTRYTSAGETTAGEMATAGGRFRTIRFHAKGGLGQVSVAVDQELGREVALKEIQDQHADDLTSRARFRLEAEITGGLEHPGIIPVYSLGCDPLTGRPYYAMRFVRGDNLHEAIKRFHGADVPGRDPGERSLAFRKLLGRFVDVCNAVAYAHSRGVLHRDLKPGNVMLGPYGETLVVDWGLARLIGRPAESAGEGPERPLRPSAASEMGETMAGSRVGTIGFMSPEQAEGRLDLLGPASDVYSLGATLYPLLTGRLAFEGQDSGAVLDKVIRGEVPPPRQVNPTAPPALDAICRKAMARRPEDRYPTPHELAEDIEHWLADEPVSALREPLTARARRWARRHRPLISGAAGLMVAALVAMVVANRLLDRERAIASDNFRMARAAVDRYLLHVSHDPRLRQQGALIPLRRELLRDGMTYYQAFLDRYGNTPGLRDEAAGAYDNLAMIAFETGDKREARKYLEKTLTLYREIGRGNSADPALRTRIGTGLRRLAVIYNKTGQPREALRAFERAREAFKALLDAPPTAEARAELAIVDTDIATLKARTEGPGPTEPYLREALALWPGLAAERPDEPAYRREWARSLNEEAYLLLRIGREADSARRFGQARNLLQNLVDRHPSEPEYRDDMGRAELNLGILQSAGGRPAEALKTLTRAREAFAGLVRDRPDYTQYRQDLAVCEIQLAEIHLRGRAWGEAIALLEQDRRSLQRLVAVDATNVQLRRDLVKALYNLGICRRNTGHPQEALDLYGRAEAIVRQLSREEPENLDVRNDAGIVANNVARLHESQKRLPEAIAAYQGAIASQRLAVDRAPDVLPYRETLNTLYLNLARCYRVAGDPERAAETTGVRAGLWPKHPAQLYDAARELADCVRVAEALRTSGRPGASASPDRYADEAIAALARAVEAGFADAGRVEAEKVFQPLRPRPDFRRLLEQLREKARSRTGQDPERARDRVASTPRQPRAIRTNEDGSGTAWIRSRNWAGTPASSVPLTIGCVPFHPRNVSVYGRPPMTSVNETDFVVPSLGPLPLIERLIRFTPSVL
jgi:eukaryotic-like serine/threonine-protein kinase